MSLHSERLTTNKTSLVNEVAPPLTAEKQVITVQPNNKSRLVFLTEPAGLAVEQYRILRRRLCNQHPNGGVILITSPSAGDGKSLTSVNLAWCLADGGQPTCLVDLDFRCPGVAPTLGYACDEGGVEDVLTGKRTITQSMRQVGPHPLYALGIKRPLISSEQLLTSSSLSPVLNDLRTLFRWVVLDCAPALPVSDVAEAIPQVDGALMVIRAGKTDRSMITPSLEILGSKIWGVVVNDCPIKDGSYYGYYGKHRE
jgi:capsular exopolysaccharide synthesis family protein